LGQNFCLFFSLCRLPIFAGSLATEGMSIH
jgi:hypothetical protein